MTLNEYLLSLVLAPDMKYQQIPLRGCGGALNCWDN